MDEVLGVPQLLVVHADGEDRTARPDRAGASGRDRAVAGAGTVGWLGTTGCQAPLVGAERASVCGFGLGLVVSCVLSATAKRNARDEAHGPIGGNGKRVWADCGHRT